jgi:hypothetical protein
MLRMALTRRDFVKAAGMTAAAALAAHPRALRAADVPFTDRGYYITFMRMPTYGLPEWKRIIDCVHADGGNLLLLWMAGAFRSKKFPITWKFNAEHANVRADFGRELIAYAQGKGIRVLLGFTPFGYDGVNQYSIEHPELKARKADGAEVDEFGIYCWGHNLCPSKEQSQRFMLEYAREMAFDFYPGADGLLIESSDYAACHCPDCSGHFYEREFPFVRAISDEVWARKHDATVVVFPHYFSRAKEVPGLGVAAAGEAFDARWSLVFSPHSAPPDAGLIRRAKSSLWWDDSPALRGPGQVRDGARKAKSLGVSGYVPSLEAFSCVPTHAEEGQSYLIGKRLVPFGFGWLAQGSMPYDELPIRVNRIAYREFTHDPDLPFEEFKRRLGRDVFGPDATAQGVDDVLALQKVFSRDRTWTQASPVVDPKRVRAMQERGELTPARRTELRAALGQVREIEKRHADATDPGARELCRIARWVLGQWEGPDAAQLL